MRSPSLKLEGTYFNFRLLRYRWEALVTTLDLSVTKQNKVKIVIGKD